jgi:hypothetical protein
MYDSDPVLPDDEAECDRQLLVLLQRWPMYDSSALLWRYYLGPRRPASEFAREMGIDPTVWARMLATFQSGLRALRDLLQPPHAAD